MVRLSYFFVTSLWLLLLFSSSALAGEVRVSLDRKQISIDESFSLSFEAEDGIDDDPDFSPLNKDFEVLRQNQGSSMQFINGQVSQLKTWNLSLVARKPGRFLIPQIAFGRDRTEPLVIEVKSANTQQNRPRDTSLFLEVSVEPTTVYVQSQILYTLRLYRSVNLADADLSAPQLTDDDAVVVKLGEDREFETTRAGQRYRVIERIYAIFPQKSGAITIAPTRFEGRIASRSRSMFGPRGGAIKRLHSKPIEVDVLPVPQDRVKGRWLPATSLRIMDRWPETDTPDEQFRVGEPVTWTLLLVAEGLTAAQLPEIPLTLPSGFKSYPDQPIMEDQTKATGLIGIRQEKIALIPTQAGLQTLPAIEIPWWNVKTKQMEVARIAERKIRVLPAFPSGTPSLSSGSASPDSVENGSAVPLPLNQTSDPGVWPKVSLVLALGWIITLIAWWRARRPVFVGPDVTEREQSPQIRVHRSALKRACTANDAPSAKEALLSWGRLVWSTSPPSLGALGSCVEGPLRLQIRALDQVLYGPSAESWCAGDDLWAAFQAEVKNDHRQRDKHFDGLTPLHP